MTWMPPAPGWLGALIDQAVEESDHVRQRRARQRLLDLGVPAADVELARSSDRALWRVVKKWRQRRCGGVIEVGAFMWSSKHPVLGFISGYFIGKGAA